MKQRKSIAVLITAVAVWFATACTAAAPPAASPAEPPAEPVATAPPTVATPVVTATPEPEPEEPQIEVEPGGNAEISLDWAGVYQGFVPAADVEGIQVQLMLQYDGFFVLSKQYVLDGPAPEIGNFTWNDEATSENGNFTWSDDGSTITLEGITDWPPHFFVAENLLIQLDMEGNFIEGDLAQNYELQKVELPQH